jgi:ATP-dependent DNA ligase
VDACELGKHLGMQLPVVPMLAKTVDRLPQPSSTGSWLYEPKYDGWLH